MLVALALPNHLINSPPALLGLIIFKGYVAGKFFLEPLLLLPEPLVSWDDTWYWYKHISRYYDIAQNINEAVGPQIAIAKILADLRFGDCHTYLRKHKILALAK